ncbi:MAG: hypothetical protein KDB48_06815 [Solirubrobacterales bacterium]|nr:hypothetical protein [Solirubrobacterales bacterium]
MEQLMGVDTWMNATVYAAEKLMSFEGVKDGLRSRDLALHYFVTGELRVLTLTKNGVEFTSTDFIGRRPFREAVLRLDRQTSHKLLCQEITFVQAKNRKLLTFEGDLVRLSWLLPHFGKACVGYQLAVQSREGA